MSRFRDEQRARMARIGVPRQVREDIDADWFDPARQAAAEARRFFRPADPRPFLFFLGGVGSGKTLGAAEGLARAGGGTESITVLEGGVPRTIERPLPLPSSLWLQATEVIRASSYDREFWATVERPDLLVLDDLGIVTLDSKGIAAGNIASLLCCREAHDRKTLVTVNLTPEAFAADYLTGPGERVRDRLKRYPDMLFIVEGASLRGRRQ